MADQTEVPAPVLDRLRAICLALPEAVEQAAWVGTRWRVGTRTFASVLVVADGWPPVYARAAGTPGPATVITFRATGPERDALRAAPPPWFAPPWHRDAVGLVLGDAVDWDEVGELLTDSHRLLAPRRLRLGGPDPG